ncbi:conserved hypothetical protein [Histoplasma capsulatum H143]|uniref:Protein kinase domain-containing protein n=1 Tax=Ajellomyces capsulatus (strain H143) TaxID=544712 RepID=C6HT01_AJECH|nr:conserved hypothetical protein [Histoplasma capsulatum H143]
MTYPLSESFCTRFHCSKPPLPYLTGSKFTVVSHNPPKPTTGSCALVGDAVGERESIHPLDRCLRHPPLPGSNGQTKVDLKIVETVRTGDNRNAQLVAVRVVNVGSRPSVPLPTDMNILAKIYDPLYFDHEQDDADPFLCVDHNYSHETAAYRVLGELQGTIIPKFFGSFSLELFLNRTTSCFVRLILIEIIPGDSMQDLDPTRFLQAERQAIMKELIDAESRLYTYDVQHRDLFPRNVLILGRPGLESRPIVIVDFGTSVVGRSRFPGIPEEEQRYLPGTPISPLLRWHEARGNRQSFQAWIDWDWQPWLEDLYGSDRASVTELMKSVWLPPFLTEPPTQPPGIA